MTTDEAIERVWNYMKLEHKLQPADVICSFGCSDLRVAARAAEVWKQGLAPWLVVSGNGSVNAHLSGYQALNGLTEAEAAAQVAIEAGVPSDSILMETEAQNTGQNVLFTRSLLSRRNLPVSRAIIVHKPYNLRRTYATCCAQWPETVFLMTAPQLTLTEYIDNMADTNAHWIDVMVGDLQRVCEYPKLGFQIEQAIPADVWAAYEHLVAAGYTRRLISG